MRNRFGKRKLSDKQIVEIRKRARAGEHQPTLAREFGVDQSTISLIKTGTTWRSVP